MKTVLIDGILYKPVHEAKISLWYMYDNHCFERIKGKTLDELAEHAFQIGKDDSCGMLCPPRIIIGDNEETIGVTVHRGFKEESEDEWREKVNKWKAAIQLNDTAMILIKKRKFA